VIKDGERAAVRRRKGNGILQSPYRRHTYGLARRHPDTHPLYMYHMSSIHISSVFVFSSSVFVLIIYKQYISTRMSVSSSIFIFLSNSIYAFNGVFLLMLVCVVSASVCLWSETNICVCGRI